jgi:hypothetical protein
VKKKSDKILKEYEVEENPGFPGEIAFGDFTFLSNIATIVKTQRKERRYAGETAGSGKPL